MSVFRIDLLVDDPEPVFEWLDANVPDGGLVRKMGYETVKGWYMKIVFKEQVEAERFNKHWQSVSRTPEVTPFMWQA